MYLHRMETGEPIVLDNFVYSDVIDGRAVSAAFDIRATRLGDGFLQNFRDVTERYRTQQDLPASQKRFLLAIDAPLDPFFIFGLVRDDQGQIVELAYRYVNQAALRLYQMPWQDVVGHGRSSCFPPCASSGSGTPMLRRSRPGPRPGLTSRTSTSTAWRARSSCRRHLAKRDSSSPPVTCPRPGRRRRRCGQRGAARSMSAGFRCWTRFRSLCSAAQDGEPY